MKRSYVDKEEIAILAKSSAIQLSEEMIREYEISLNEVIASMEKALALDILDTPAESFSVYTINPEDLRDDIAKDNFSREEFLRNVPESLGGLVKVPTVIK
ncbi:Asp-tRNA(Asn)/Glu-tRNA(Gln) amidotransferase subunit GatC [Candidatus Chlamydia sanziniae]|uniref:Aspartyl/glutamyl-tRNA(Asn/Gln) amidotransferase subunit C n=1 Tax=Candidatus Chlamydia sanziniae TaxID=1806891 RepID=A0A1A9HTC4_9CHLA|nr:Asp-tRNA(Asn)/Glu-tRNA(Gln) amidotransferase subunit GatC [Candidatus Chlamydia sanziniae]ANH78238.1 Aspartyl-tRNA amidotransferase subunit C [Candidatus Chlamydia sanziniae]